MRLLSRARGQPGAGRAPAQASRPLARAHRPHARVDPPCGVRHPRGVAPCSRVPTPPNRSRCPPWSTPRPWTRLRVEYRRVLLRLASRDLAHHLGVDDAAAELADLAAGTLDAALAIARAKVGEDSSSCRLAVIAMGKCGGHELNYVSDVDVIFVAEPADGAESPEDERQALKAATQLASTLMQVCSENTAEGTIWPVDANLRPEGKSGPLVRTIASHCGYYERWAKTWEFQALLKARPVAGDMELGRQYDEVIKPMVWSAAEREGFVEEVQSMRRRVLDHIPADQRRAPAQARLGWAARRGVRRTAAADGARPHRRGGPHAGHAQCAGPAHRGGLRRTRRRAVAARRLRVPAHAGAPDPALPAPAYPRDARGGGGAAPAGSLARLPQGPGARARQAVALPPARGAAAAREALLPPAALRGGQGRRRGPAQPRGRQGAAGRPRLPRPQRRPAPPRGADRRCHPHGADPAHPAAGRCSSGSRTHPTRTPACSASGGSPRRWAPRRGTSGCCATRARRRSGWRRCSRPAATPPTCSSASPRASRSSARTSASSR